MSDQDRILGHSDEADGIEEYDNRLPTWWLGLFYFTIAWGVVYAVEYHLVTGRSQAAQFDAEVADAEAKWPTPTALVANSPADIEAGKGLFATNCVGCHGPDAKGTQIAPDLTDATWIHGGKLEDITKTVTEGVPAKGMVTWGPILGPQKVAQVAAYVHLLGGGQ